MLQHHSRSEAYGSYPDEQKRVRLCQQRGQIVLDAQHLAHVLSHLRGVLVHTLDNLLPRPLGDLLQGDYQVLHLDLQV